MSLIRVPLEKLAYARSGDKGAHVNIGVIARSPSYYRFLSHYLNEEKVAQHFAAFAPKMVKRYSWDSIEALNFILYNVLEGGGSLSLRADAQGKTFAQALLLMSVEIPKELFVEI